MSVRAKKTRKLRRALTAYIRRKAEEKPRHVLLLPHWVRADTGDRDLDNSVEDGLYCEPCCNAEVDKLRDHDGDDVSFSVAGGWELEASGPLYCATCHAGLDTVLSDYGVELMIREFDGDWHGLLDAVLSLQESKPLTDESALLWRNVRDIVWRDQRRSR